MSHPMTATPTGFLVIACGGSARAAIERFGQGYEADGRPFPKVALYADTERGSVPAADCKLDLGLDFDDVSVIHADPAAVGPTAETLLAEYPQFLNRDSIENGSRTIISNTHSTWWSCCTVMARTPIRQPSCGRRSSWASSSISAASGA